MPAGPFDLNLRHLRAVAAIDLLGSISAGASAVNLSQPALTQGLAKLERQLGYSLFDRRAGGMIATPLGSIVAERVRSAMTHLAGGFGKMPRGFTNPERLITATQIRAFIAVADAGSYATAARSTGLSQTAVHRAVFDLEQVVGGALVERRGRGIWLNAAGRRLARSARLAVAEIAAAISEIGADPAGSLVTIGATPLSRCFVLPKALARMVEDQRRARFQILEGGWQDLSGPLRDGVIDIVVGALRSYEVADLEQTPLYDDRLVIVAGSHHPLAGMARTPTAGELANYPWVVGRPNSPLRTQWELLFKGRDPPNVPIECGSVMIISRLLTEGDFLTLLSPDQVALQIKSGLLAAVGSPLPDSLRTIGLSPAVDGAPPRSSAASLNFCARSLPATRLMSVTIPSMFPVTQGRCRHERNDVQNDTRACSASRASVLRAAPQPVLG